jgi:hypothetical protein
VEHVAGVEDYQVALATYRAASERWPGTPITLRHGARVIEDSRRLRLIIPSERRTFREEPPRASDKNVVSFLHCMNDPRAEGLMASHIGRRKFLAMLGSARRRFMALS